MSRPSHCKCGARLEQPKGTGRSRLRCEVCQRDHKRYLDRMDMKRPARRAWNKENAKHWRRENAEHVREYDRTRRMGLGPAAR